MNRKTIIYLILSVILFVCPGLRAAAYDQETEYWLQQLDGELLKTDDYIRQKQERVDLLNAQRLQMKGDEERYYQNRQVYDECLTFDSELAMQVVDDNIAIAQRAGDRDREVEWQIKRSFLLSSTGLLMESLQSMEGMNSQQLSRELRIQYYNQMQYL